MPRDKRGRTAFVLGKKTEYFHNMAFKTDAWPRLATEANVELIGHVTTKWGNYETPSIIHDRGAVSPREFSQSVAESAVMIGTGMPGASPSPYVALCQGELGSRGQCWRDLHVRRPFDYQERHSSIRIESERRLLRIGTRAIGKNGSSINRVPSAFTDHREA